MTPKISVIIPVYNTREFLATTLRNIIEDQFASMTPAEWEVIVVDDGSSDGSHTVVESWMKRYPESLRLIRKQNGGVSSARNEGLASARGNYVYFMDSDDLLLRNALPGLISVADKTGSDIVKFHFSVVEDAAYRSLSADVPEASFAPEQTFDAAGFLEYTRGMVGVPNHVATVVSFYRRGFLMENNLRYDTDFGNGEDELFIWSCMLRNPRVAYVNSELYIYNQRADSASHKLSAERLSNYYAERIRFTGRMIGVLSSVKNAGLMSDALVEHVAGRYRYFYQLYVVEMIVRGLSISKLFGAMRYYRKSGGDVHPGRPRFTPYYESSAMPLKVKLRRAAVAYPLALLIWSGL